MSGASREELLALVRARLGRAAGDPVPEPPRLDPTLMRLCDDASIDRYERAAVAAGMHVHRTRPEDLESALATVLAAVGATRVALAVGDESLRAAMRRAAAACTIIDAPTTDDLFDADVGVTDVEAAVAETGSVVVSSDRTGVRAAHVAPPVHVAIVRAAQIVPDLLDLLSVSRFPEGLPPGLVLVTGPSKTGDIEGILVEGVHGPQSVHVIVIE